MLTECSNCGHQVKKTLAQRQHQFPNCNLSIGRDLNTAINIKNRAKVLIKYLLPQIKLKSYKGLSLFAHQLERQGIPCQLSLCLYIRVAEKPALQLVSKFGVCHGKIFLFHNFSNLRNSNAIDLHKPLVQVKPKNCYPA